MAPFNTSQTQRALEKIRNDGYDFKELVYPENLGNDSIGLGHFILFNINVTKGSTVGLGSSRVIDNEGSIIPSRPRSEVGNANNARAQISANGGTSRISTAIALYMPDNVTSSYAVNWEQGEFTAPQAFLKTVNSVKASVTDAINNYDKDIIAGIQQTYNDASIDATGRLALDFAQSTLGGSEIGNAISLFRRQLRNPYMDFLFKGISPRSFSMNFRFMPSTDTETERVREIIKQFKLHALPEVTRAGSIFGMFYKYPSEFDITFFSGFNQNKYLFNFSTCALTNVEVNYAASGQWSAFRENSEGAAPTHVELTLTFTELELLTRERIDQGF